MIRRRRFSGESDSIVEDAASGCRSYNDSVGTGKRPVVSYCMSADITAKILFRIRAGTFQGRLVKEAVVILICVCGNLL
jgi:hypothetical protein